MEVKKRLYIEGYDRNGVFRFSIPNGSSIPSGIIAGKGWTLRTVYQDIIWCSACNSCGDNECLCGAVKGYES